MKLLQNILSVTLVFLATLSYGSEPVVIGQTFTLHSSVLNKKATINITLPESYQASTNKRYPVFYRLGDDDGYATAVGTIRALSHAREYPMPETILVSLTTDTAVEIINRGVKSEDFINLLEIDVIPHIDKHYRTQPFRILSSGARFGMAPLHAFIHKTHLFNAFITINPWITAESGLLEQFDAFLKTNNDIASFLWLSSGGEHREHDNYMQLISLLQQQAPNSLDWHSAQYNNNTHMSQGLISLPSALEHLFADLHLTTDSAIVKAGAKSIQDYYQQLSTNKYGYKVSAEKTLSDYGYALLRNQEIKASMEVFSLNLQAYPNSPHVYTAMAWAHKIDGNWQAALPMQKKGYELALKQKQPF